MPPAAKNVNIERRLHIALRKGDLASLRRLAAQRGPSGLAGAISFRSALSYTSNPKVLPVLLGLGVPRDGPVEEFSAALHGGSRSVIQWWFENTPDLPKLPRQQKVELLRCAIESGTGEDVLLILSAGTDPSTVIPLEPVPGSPAPAFPNSALWHSVRHDNLQATEVLIQAGARVQDEMLALAKAPRVFAKLLASGAKLRASHNHEWLNLFNSTPDAKEAIAVFEEWAGGGPSSSWPSYIIQPDPATGDGLLHRVSSPEVLSWAMTKGLDPNETNHAGCTPLASHASRPGAIKELLCGGAIPTQADIDHIQAVSNQHTGSMTSRIFTHETLRVLRETYAVHQARSELSRHVDEALVSRPARRL